MARCVQQGQVQTVQRQAGLFGENGDAPLPLLGVGVQKGVPVVHPSQAAQLSALIEQRLRQGGLARIHMGKQTSTNAFEIFFSGSSPITFTSHLRKDIRVFIEKLQHRKNISQIDIFPKSVG